MIPLFESVYHFKGNDQVPQSKYPSTPNLLEFPTLPHQTHNHARFPVRIEAAQKPHDGDGSVHSKCGDVRRHRWDTGIVDDDLSPSAIRQALDLF